MTESQQHDIRNGAIVIWRIGQWFLKNVRLNKVQTAMMNQLCDECQRIGRACGMSGMEQRQGWFSRIFRRRWW